MSDETGPSPEEMGLSEKDRQMAGLKPEVTAENQRQRIDDLNSKLKSHFRGQWEEGAPADQESRTQLLNQELEDYASLTGFPAQDKKRLESISKNMDDWGVDRGRTYPGWTQDRDNRASLEKAEKAAIEQKLGPSTPAKS